MSKLSNPTDRVKVKKMLDEISASYTRIAAEKDLIKETIADLSKQFEIPKRVLAKMAKTYHKQSFYVEQEEHDDFEELYENVVITNTL